MSYRGKCTICWPPETRGPLLATADSGSNTNTLQILQHSLGNSARLMVFIIVMSRMQQLLNLEFTVSVLRIPLTVSLALAAWAHYPRQNHKLYCIRKAVN